MIPLAPEDLGEGQWPYCRLSSSRGNSTSFSISSIATYFSFLVSRSRIDVIPLVHATKILPAPQKHRESNTSSYGWMRHADGTLDMVTTPILDAAGPSTYFPRSSVHLSRSKNLAEFPLAFMIFPIKQKLTIISIKIMSIQYNFYKP